MTEFEEKAAYVLGIVSIVLALSLFSPLGGLISAITGLVISKKSKSDLGKKARKINKAGLVISVIVLVLVVGVTVYALSKGLGGAAPSFPTY